MKKLFAIIILVTSFGSFAEDLTQNSNRKVIVGKDFLNHDYLIIQSDMKTEIYSMEQLFTQHNKVSSIILNPNDFERMVFEFSQKNGN